MRTVIDPGKERRSVNFIDNICFSHVTDLEGKPLDLYLSLMVQNGNSEMRLADGRDDEVSTGKQPVIVWINGAGWRACDKNLMAAEMEFLAEAGYAVACITYRNSSLGHFPDQLIDCKTAVRFLRAHAQEYNLDPARVGTIGRSAGGHLSTWMSLNTDGFDSQEWADQSSKIQAAVNMFGPTDIAYCARKNMEMIKDPSYRWHNMSETHEGALLGVTPDMPREEILALAEKAGPINFLHKEMTPLAILHGDQDPLVDCQISENLYQKMVDLGLEDQTRLYILKNGGHGTREFFQPSTKKLILEFFDQYLK